MKKKSAIFIFFKLDMICFLLTRALLINVVFVMRTDNEISVKNGIEISKIYSRSKKWLRSTVHDLSSHLVFFFLMPIVFFHFELSVPSSSFFIVFQIQMCHHNESFLVSSDKCHAITVHNDFFSFSFVSIDPSSFYSMNWRDGIAIPFPFLNFFWKNCLFFIKRWWLNFIGFCMNSCIFFGFLNEWSIFVAFLL